MKTIKKIIRVEIDNSLDWLNDIEPSQWDIMESVGGDLDLGDTPLSKKYSEKEIRNMVNVGGFVGL